MSSLPPWATSQLLEPVQLDNGNQIDVTPYVRFETAFDDIDYGVLDVEVAYQQEGHPVHMYLLHYFALTERRDKNGNLCEGWRDQFEPRLAPNPSWRLATRINPPVLVGLRRCSAARPGRTTCTMGGQQ